MLIELAPFYKVIVLKVGLFASKIVDEKHFLDEIKAQWYSDMMCNNGFVTTIINIQ